MRESNILDPIQPTLSPLIWDKPESEQPELKPHIAHWITKHIFQVLESGSYSNPEQWLKLVLSGSLTTYQFSKISDCDVALFVDSKNLPEWSRAEMIGLMIEYADGVTVPGTPYPMQCFVVSKNFKPTDLYKKGLRSGYDIRQGRWIEPPDHDRDHDVESQENGFYAHALQMADKMERLLRYEPEKAKLFWHQIHKKRQRDQTAGKGDFSESNIVYKFLNNRNLFPRLSELSGEHIAHTTRYGQDLEGLPQLNPPPNIGPLPFHANEDIRRIANEYNQANGLGPHPTNYVLVNPANAARVAQEYEAMSHNPNDPQVASAYDALKREVGAQYQHAVDNGYNFEFYPQTHDPYPNSPREAVLDLHQNKHMYVYPTATGYGSEGQDQDPQDHPLLGDSGVRWGGQPVTHNDLFRAIHDFYGHAKEGLGFRAHGEDNAYRQHAAMFSPQAQQALASETRGQNSWVNFGPHGETNQTAGQADTVYAPQKAGLMPAWTTDPNLNVPHPQQTFARTATSLTQTVYDAILSQGGITINLQGHQPIQGYAYAIPGNEVQIPEAKLSPASIDQYLANHQQELSTPNAFLGAWVHQGIVFLDVSMVEQDQQVAYQNAQANNQLAMFDLGTFNEIPVENSRNWEPTPTQ